MVGFVGIAKANQLYQEREPEGLSAEGWQMLWIS